MNIFSGIKKDVMDEIIEKYRNDFDILYSRADQLEPQFIQLLIRKIQLELDRVKQIDLIGERLVLEILLSKLRSINPNRFQHNPELQYQLYSNHW